MRQRLISGRPCPAGHPLTEDNLLERRNGRLECRACRAERRYRASLDVEKHERELARKAAFAAEGRAAVTAAREKWRRSAEATAARVKGGRP